MLEELRIENFQAHERKRIKFDHRVTTIIGPSDRGKSAIIRALRWVCLNDLRGDAFVRDGADFVRVSLLLDGTKITRTKKGIANTYKMGNETYVALRTDVPEDIKAVLNVDTINFQAQHDAPFWFSLSPGQVSRELNAIVDLGVIDATLKNLNSVVRDAKARVEVCTEQVRDSKRELNRFNDLAGMVADFRVLEGLESRAAGAASRAIGMGLLLSDIQRHSDSQKSLTARATDARILVKLTGTVLETRKQVEILESAVQAHENAKQTSEAPDFGPVSAARIMYVEATERAGVLASLIDRIESMITANKLYNQNLKEALDAVKEACDGVCPVCEQPLP